MTTALVMIGIIIILAVVCVVMGKILFKKNSQIKEAETAQAEAEAKAAETKRKVEAVLDYEKQDDVLVQQREKHVAALVKTKSKDKTDEEIKSLMSDLRDAYNSL